LIIATTEPPTLEAASIAPNPVAAQGTLTLSFSTSRATELQLQLVDAVGRVVWQQGSIAVDAGEHQYPISAEQVGAGWYQLLLTSDSGHLALPVVIMK
jgi:hypothetical protein